MSRLVTVVACALQLRRLGMDRQSLDNSVYRSLCLLKFRTCIPHSYLSRVSLLSSHELRARCCEDGVDAEIPWSSETGFRLKLAVPELAWRDSSFVCSDTPLKWF